jgi:hypothetical protein
VQPSFVRSASEQVPGAIVGAGLTFLFSTLLRRWRARESKQAAARDLTSQVTFVLRRLNSRIEGLDEARDEDQPAVISYFNRYAVLWDGEDAALFRGAIQSARVLDLHSLDAWRECVAALAAAQTKHHRMLAVVALPDKPNLDARASGYRQALVEVKGKLQIAIRAARPYADRECARAIDQLLQG